MRAGPEITQKHGNGRWSLPTSSYIVAQVHLPFPSWDCRRPKYVTRDNCPKGSLFDPIIQLVMRNNDTSPRWNLIQRLASPQSSDKWGQRATYSDLPSLYCHPCFVLMGEWITYSQPDQHVTEDEYVECLMIISYHITSFNPSRGVCDPLPLPLHNSI